MLLQFILYCVNLSLILKMPNWCRYFFLSKSVYPAVGLKNLISAASIFLLSHRFRDKFSLLYIRTGTAREKSLLLAYLNEVVWLINLIILALKDPYILGDPDTFIPANPLVTPIISPMIRWEDNIRTDLIEIDVHVSK